MSEDFLKELNEAQYKAATAIDGPVLVLAGAGSGKTKTLVYRIAHLLRSGIYPSQILAVTFTNKAAKEMRERVQELYLNLGGEKGTDFTLPYLGTFHSICVRILRREGQHIGIPSNFVIYDDGDRMQLIKQILKNNLNIQDIKLARPILSLISKMKNDGLTQEDLEFNAKTPNEKITAEAWPIYKKKMDDLGALDFDDLILKTAELFSTSQEVREAYKSRFKHILVDEYQDTNPIQYKLLKSLTEEKSNIFVVGDDWQSIYSWRGADYRIILNFEQDFPGAQVIKLEQNYRSTQNILDVAHKIITKNTSRSAKELFTEEGPGKDVELMQASSENHEAEMIVSKMRDLISEEDRQWRDFVVLYRTNAQSRSFEEAFMRTGTPYQIVGGVRFYERKEVKDLISYLRLIYNPNDSVSFDRIINVPARGIGAKSLLALQSFAAEKGSLSAALAFLDQCPGISGKALTSAQSFYSKIEKIRSELLMNNVADTIQIVISKFGLDEFYNDNTPQGIERLENLRELASVATAQGATDLGAFLEDVALVSDLDSLTSEGDSVTLMTIHGSKGLEFPVVFIAGLEEGVFPHSRSAGNQEELEEERRLAYVAMTRAREALYLIYATRRIIYGNPQNNPPSRFVTELLDENIIKVAPGFSLNPTSILFGGFQPQARDIFSEAEQVNQTLSQGGFKQQVKPETNSSLAEGSKVSHPSFGVGTVVEINEPMATIVFSSGPKQLHLEYAPLSLV
ncbi:MAG: ATP-dependent helicase UvrD/PcrA [Patescibacteria group bacterium]|nr:ATP-dependent helicase UvrD/PcrA [Patescibacteria group bacterium]